MNARTSPSGLIALVAITGVLTIGLHQLGGIPGLAVNWSDPIGWLEASHSEEAIGGLLRSIGLLISYWVLGSTALYLAFGLRQRGRRPGWVTLITHRWIRRIADRALAVTLTASIVATPIGPAMAELPSAPIVFEAETDGIPVPHVRMDMSGRAPDQAPETDQLLEEISIADEPASPNPPPLTPIPISTPTASVVVEQSQNHTVVRGDNLWTIAADHIASTHAGGSDASEITEYWLKVITANRDTLRSGDPNLIFPGEIVALPALTETP
jgi:hypothetical protein